MNNLIALILLLTNKIGYKKIIVVSPIILLLKLFACIYSKISTVILISNIIINGRSKYQKNNFKGKRR